MNNNNENTTNEQDQELAQMSAEYNAALKQIKAISRELVDKTGYDVVKAQGITKHGRGALTNTDCFRLVLCYIEAEFEETFDLSLIEDPDEQIEARRKLQMYTWKRYPKNPSAFQKHTPFFPDTDDNNGGALIDKYSDI